MYKGIQASMCFQSKTKIRRNFGKSKKAWFKEHVNDHYVLKAKAENYRSRASFKLLQILEKHKSIKLEKVLDLGCAPGSWCQVVLQKNPTAKLVGVDLLEMKEIAGIQFQQTDARNEKLHKYLLQKYGHFETILSDMAPNFSGDCTETHEQIMQLNKMCLKLIYQLGAPSSTLVMKTLQGPKQKIMFNFLSCFFEKVERLKPKSSKSESQEFFYICQKLEQISQDHQKLFTFLNNFSLEGNKGKTTKTLRRQLEQALS